MPEPDPITPANVETYITRLTVVMNGMKVGSRQWVRHAYRVYRLTYALGVHDGTCSALESLVPKATVAQMALDAFNESVQSIPKEEIDD